MRNLVSRRVPSTRYDLPVFEGQGHTEIKRQRQSALREGPPVGDRQRQGERRITHGEVHVLRPQIAAYLKPNSFRVSHECHGAKHPRCLYVDKPCKR